MKHLIPLFMAFGLTACSVFDKTADNGIVGPKDTGPSIPQETANDSPPAEPNNEKAADNGIRDQEGTVPTTALQTGTNGQPQVPNNEGNGNNGTASSGIVGTQAYPARAPLAFIRVEESTWPTLPSRPKETQTTGCPIAGLYTRVVFDSQVNQPGNGNVETRSYKDEERTLLGRLIAGRDRATSLLLYVEVGSGQFQQTAPLFNASHQSNSSVGEKWFTAVVATDLPTPYFLVQPNSTIKFTYEYNNEESFETDVLKTAVDSARLIVGAVAPGSDVVTDVSRGAFREQAAALDRTFAALFGRSLTEQVSYRHSLEYAPPKAEQTVKLLAPDSSDRLTPEFTVGTWTARLAPPKVSVFHTQTVPFPTQPKSDETECKKQIKDTRAEVARELNSALVAGFAVGQNETLRSYVNSQAGLDTQFAIYAASSDVRQGRAICTQILRSLENLGLSSFDQEAGLWALVLTAGLSSEQVNSLTEACRDVADFKKFGAPTTPASNGQDSGQNNAG